ncbi:DUF1330 domain-containing protein [Thiomonas sp.]|jgi:uncharacterized protein (DUF1330 family)|uniref:DUF1330 domain-containing protein n=1 Tax=Thiomonas sp. TaxID=2047785 RepID=UPI0026267E17|nr:DUF1330 domain-containing protein [Thiomonas sp.]
MAAYLIADTLLTDPDAYEEYKRKARPLAEKHGGEYVVRGGDMVIEESELWSPSRLVVVRFPSVEQARAFYESPEYQQALGISKRSARRTVVIVEGV